MAEELSFKYRQEDIVPFWKKLPFFFLFPFRFGPLVFMVCIVAASAVAGLVLGGYGLVFKGFLVYLGLRYAFNVLELFSKGRFEGESVDHRLWGPEKRPAKLGMVIALFITLAINLGNSAVVSRIAKDSKAQDLIIERYKKENAAELAAREREREAFNKRIGLAPSPGDVQGGAIQGDRPSESDEDSQDFGGPSAGTAVASEPAALPAPDLGPSRAEILEAWRPHFSDPLWSRLQPGWYWALLIALSLLLPSAAIVIALEDNFFKALNPLNMIYFMQSMGSAYFTLWAFFLAIAGTRQVALTTEGRWPTALQFPVEMAAATYLALVLFAVMGYALYQFHQELHLDVDVDFDEHRQAGGAEAIAQAGSARAAIRQVDKEEPWEHKVRTLLAEGNLKEAIAEIKDRMRYDRHDPELNTRLHALYVMQGERDTTLAHGQQWLTGLVRANRRKEALSALRGLLAIDPGFAVQDGDVVLPTAAAAYQQGEHALTTSLLRSFDKRFPQHKDTPAVFFLGAKLLSEQGRQHEKAARILRAVLAHFPGHEIAGEARTYLSVLEKMLAQSAAPGTPAR